jgi:RND family efflux transporter MFP subunit
MKTNQKAAHALLGLCFLTTLLAMSAGCNSGVGAQKEIAQNKEAKQTLPEPPPKLVKHTFTYKIDVPGEIRADEQTQIFAKITGYVEKINKDIGDAVKEGEILAELSVPDLDEELLQKQALAVQAKAELERVKKLHAAAVANVRFAEAKVQEAVAARPRAAAELARAESQYDRLKKTTSIIADEAIAETKLGFEAWKAATVEVEARIKSAEAWHAKSAADRDSAFSEIAVAEARLRAREATARNMKEILKYAKLTAPYSGVVIKRGVDLGDFVQSSAGASKGEPIFVVARVNPVRIYVDVPENDAVLVKDDAKAIVRVQALKGEEFKGIVKRSAFALDPKGRILRTEIDLPNPDRRLRPGMYAYASITIIHENVWAVPVSAIMTKDHRTFCHIVENGKARLTPVLVGLRDGQFIEVRKKQTAGSESDWQEFTGKEEISSGQ